METKINKGHLRNFTRHLAVFFIFLFLISCELGNESAQDFSPGEGKGGSMARFTITGNHLYTVDQKSLKVFNLTDPQKPVFVTTRDVGFDVETIFPMAQNLFMGTSTGMYIYSISTPADPQKISFYEHIFSCDPVVSDGKYAYVTLSSSNSRCWRAVNELQIVDIQNLKNPSLVSSYTLSGPRGLAVRNDTLWICDSGIKIYDIKNKKDIRLIRHFDNLQAFDIILNNNLILVIGESGFTQYKLENDIIRKLSEINVNQ